MGLIARLILNGTHHPKTRCSFSSSFKTVLFGRRKLSLTRQQLFSFPLRKQFSKIISIYGDYITMEALHHFSNEEHLFFAFVIDESFAMTFHINTDVYKPQYESFFLWNVFNMRQRHRKMTSFKCY